MEGNLWRRGWCGRSGILVILLLLLAFLSTWSGGGWSGSGSVSAQLYTSIDDVAEAVDNLHKPKDDKGNPLEKEKGKSTPSFLPLGPLKPTLERKVHSDGTPMTVPDWNKDKTKPYPLRTCTAPIQVTEADYNEKQADDYNEFKGAFQLRYLCVGLPRFPNVQETKTGFRGEKDRTHSPYSHFWVTEETATNWHRHKPYVSGYELGEIHQKAKDLGLLFRIDVTGIKTGIDKGSGGRFLKGWYHLKVSLDIDHNILDKNKEPFPETADQEKLKLANEYKNEYVIDKLIVSARGRSMTGGRPQNMTDLETKNKTLVKRPPRRMWVGGIGEFVQDFPKCKDVPVDPFVYQQFMSCGTVAYAESKYGNNFYYSRNQNPDKYGGLSRANDAIHINFRLDMSFCNRYYDVDFVATGMASQKKSSSSDNVVNSQPILRSISTRFTFISSYEHHYPDYYENADPVPRHEKEVDCGQDLLGEWEFKPKVNNENTQNTTEHWMSVTAGAAMKLTGASPDATFFGAIKHVTKVPEKLYNTQFNKDTRAVENEEKGEIFSARRTWVYGHRFLRWQGHKGYSWRNPWRMWNDINGLPQEGGLRGLRQRDTASTLDNEKYQYDEVPILYSAVQRVLNELNWETWVERRKETNSYEDESCFKDLEDPGGYDSNPLARGDNAGYWPHPYYDVTCGGIDIKGVDGKRLANGDDGYKNYRTYVGPLYRGGAAKSFYYPYNDFDKSLPPITGRCVASLWKTPGFGSKDNDPPKCNEFFYESKLWRDWKDDKVINGKKRSSGAKPPAKALSDPALAQVIKAVDRQQNGSRTNWTFAYLSDHSKAVQKVICDKADLLEEEYPDCLFIGAKPYTPRNPTHHPPTKEEQEAIDYAEKARLEFKRTPAYKRGMLVNDSPYSMYIWDSRLVHGLFATVITLFVTPVSIFMTRYFKETFMDTRIFLHHIWYFVHIGASFATQLLFLISMWRQSKTHELLGYSLGGNSKFHRVAGWLAIGISVFSFFFGGLRTMNRKMRAATMVVHFFAGWIFYLLCLACMMSSLAIPGSPAAYEDYTTSSITGDFQKSLIEPVLIAVVVWFLFDIIMHTIMTILQCRNDKKMLLTRSRYYHLSPMPVIAETFRFDTPGRFPRIYLLCIYVLVSLAATITACVFMYNYSPRGRGLGFMSCTHSSAETGHEVFTEFPKDC